MNKNIDEIEFTIFDTETTGLDPEGGDRVVEIAAVRIKGKARIGEFQALVNPHREISPAAFGVNHISASMLKDAPGMEEVLPKFLSFIQDSQLCSYNATFDLEFLNHELMLAKQESLKDMIVIDALKMAKRLLPGLERYALWFVADKLGISTKQEHRAFSDVELTLEAFYKFKEMLEQKDIVDSRNFTSLFGLNSKFLEDIHNQKIAQIQEAMDLGVRLKVKYISSTSAKVTEREVVPKEIRKERNNIYLVGFCCLRNQERSFRIDGILHLEIL